MSASGMSGIKLQIAFAIVGIAAQGCSSASDEPASRQIDQALAGNCGVDPGVCVAHSACTSWDSVMVGDGLGYTTSSWIETGPYFTYSFDLSGGDDWDTVDTCPEARDARQAALIASRPGISQPALNDFGISVEYVYYDRTEWGCGPYDQYCNVTEYYYCNLHVNYFPTPNTEVHDWCPCGDYG